jgi:hypothetical protein
MRHIYLVVSIFAFLVLVSRTSSAQTAPGRTGVGLGAEATTTGIVGATFVYDAEVFHLDALFGAALTKNDTNLEAAARFFFPLHHAQAADFSVGPGIGLVHGLHQDNAPPNGPAPASTSTNQVHLEGALQIRAFVVSNVAFSASAGLGIVFANGNNTAVIGGQVGASLGITYFFF